MKTFNKNKLYPAVFLVAAASVPLSAVAAAPDFTTLTTAVDLSSVGTTVLAVAATLAAVFVTIRGAKLVLGMIRGR
ncbi:hypothetical protein WM40_25095 [Robbsia andropogonis]|uniref:Phage-related membrane protein n=1 Tax=Robbsia andropogonis TaxID=28092 RepID=A0A0F5JU18_9BURK|nr:hypothetical protein [Robbsia andropogonis]KKB61114.1 hypothetical protein WM40_25095 [Robbsia andropogonis]